MTSDTPIASKGEPASSGRCAVAEGGSVMLGDVQLEKAQELAAELGERAAATHLDVRDLAQWEAAVSATRGRFGKLTLAGNMLKPLSWRKPRKIFVNSMSDLFWDQVPTSYVDRVVDVIDRCPQHVFQVLTKRPARMAEYSRSRRLPPNFWAGATVESARWSRRIDELREVKAEVRFLSLEPLLSPMPGIDLAGISWVIVGGESGVHLAKPSTREGRSLAEIGDNGKWVPRADRVQWVRDIRDACRSQNVPLWFKQWGGIRPGSSGCELDGKIIHERPLPCEGSSTTP
jgi:protein gp37